MVTLGSNLTSFGSRMLLEEAVDPDMGEVEHTSDALGASRAVLTQIILLAVALALGQWLEKKKVDWLGDAGVALLLGIGMGILSRVFTFNKTYVAWMGFSEEFFFIALLPPIMFEAGFSLQVKPFFRNIGAICTFAFAGTVISCFLVGLIMWAGGALGLSYGLTSIESLVFGAIISTTDTVTIVAVLQRLGANEDLFALVFGESCLNDAVGIVLYRTLTIFLHRRVTAGSVLLGLGSFVGVFLGSVLTGVGVAFFASLVFKTKFLRHHHAPLESCMVILFAFASYMLADGFGLSGIVSILFCGLVSAHYVRPNISRNARDRTAAFFKVLSVLAEMFCFLYIGTSISMNTTAWRHGSTWLTLIVAIVALAVSRALNIWPNAAVINMLRPPDLRIPQAQQFMIWFSGMRGAMAFAMVLRALEDLPAATAHVLLVVIFFVILITVLVNGGASATVMRRLRLRAEDDISMVEAALQHGAHRDGRHVHISLGDVGPAGLAALDAQGVERSGGSVGRSEASFTSASGYSSGYGSDAEAGPRRHRSFTLSPGRVLTRVREANREGILSRLDRWDERYLQKIFLGGKKAKELEMSEMSSQGDDDSPEADHRARAVHFQDEAAAAEAPTDGALKAHQTGSGSLQQQLGPVTPSPASSPHAPSGGSPRRPPQWGGAPAAAPAHNVPHRLADFDRAGVHQEDPGDELLPEVEEARAPMMPRNQPRSDQ